MSTDKSCATALDLLPHCGAGDVRFDHLELLYIQSRTGTSLETILKIKHKTVIVELRTWIKDTEVLTHRSCQKEVPIK